MRQFGLINSVRLRREDAGKGGKGKGKGKFKVRLCSWLLLISFGEDNWNGS